MKTPTQSPGEHIPLSSAEDVLVLFLLRNPVGLIAEGRCQKHKYKRSDCVLIRSLHERLDGCRQYST